MSTFVETRMSKVLGNQAEMKLCSQEQFYCRWNRLNDAAKMFPFNFFHQIGWFCKHTVQKSREQCVCVCLSVSRGLCKSNNFAASPCLFFRSKLNLLLWSCAFQKRTWSSCDFFGAFFFFYVSATGAVATGHCVQIHLDFEAECI